jgi:hypothetical protein
VVVPAAAGATQVCTSLEEATGSTTDNYQASHSVIRLGLPSHPHPPPPKPARSILAIWVSSGDYMRLHEICGHVRLFVTTHSHQAYMYVLLSCFGDLRWSSKAHASQYNLHPPMCSDPSRVDM